MLLSDGFNINFTNIHARLYQYDICNRLSSPWK